MESENKPKTGSQPMNVPAFMAKQMGNLPVGQTKNIRIVPVDKMTKKKKIRQDVQRSLDRIQNPPTKGGDVDPETGDLIPEGVKKAGHPESYELGLDGETISNPEYQRILRRKRIERAASMSDPNHPTHTDDNDDMSQDDVEAADRAARRKKRIGESMEKQGMLFKMQAEPKVTTVIPAVVGDERKRSIDRASKKRRKQIKKYEDLPAPVYGKEAY